MVTVRYEIVEHDGGWAYRANGSISETYPTHDAARKAAEGAAARQTVAGDTDGIVYQDRDGVWREELADGHDRPQTRVIDES